MSQQSPQSAGSAGMKQKIISHMNADHADSLTMYLRNYCGVSPQAAKSAKLSDITLEHMVIESGAGRNLVPFKPPMKSFAEARERTVAMHHESLKALGISDVKITGFWPHNKVWQWGVFFVCLWCYGTFPFPEQIRPESSSLIAYGWSFGGRVPALARLASELAPKVLRGMIVIHAAESTFFWWSRLRKHGFSLGNPSTWLWIVNAFISGGACINRFDDLVEEKRKAKESKH